MPRNPRSATTLIEEIRQVVPDLEVASSDLDGFGVYRTFRLTSEGYKGLDDVVHAVVDNRITGSESIGKGVEVRFTHQARHADNTKPFGVHYAAETLLTKKRPPKKRVAPPDAD